MNSLKAATTDILAWGTGRGAWPSSGPRLVDIVRTGFLDLGAPFPALVEAPDGAWIASFFAATATLVAGNPQVTSARSTHMLRSIREHGKYHLAVVERAVGGLQKIADAWSGTAQPAIRVSLGEMVAHLADAFVREGRVPHCGEASRSLLSGAHPHSGEEPYRPPQPPYRYAGESTAEISLPFGLPIFVDTQDDSVCPDIIRTGWWEPWIHGLVAQCVGRGDTVVNVGANVGYHTLLLAHLVQDAGRVFAFEPHPRLVRLLRRSLTWGGLLETTTLLPFAASDGATSQAFAAAPSNMGAGALTDDKRTGALDALAVARGRVPFLSEDRLHTYAGAMHPAPKEFTVPTVSLDESVGKAVNEVHFMIIDVEGAQCAVLDGGRDLIQRSRDLTMVVEWSNIGAAKLNPERAGRTVEWLAAQGFAFWHIGADTADVYSRPAILTPMQPEAVLAIETYADLYLTRRRSSD